MSGLVSEQGIIPGLLSEPCSTRANEHSSDEARGLLRLYGYKLRYWTRNAFQIAAFFALNLLAVLGLLVLFFVILGRGRANGFFVHLNEVASRFLEATPTRQADFLTVLMAAVLALFILVSALRSNGLRDRLGRSV